MRQGGRRRVRMEMLGFRVLGSETVIKEGNAGATIPAGNRKDRLNRVLCFCGLSSSENATNTLFDYDIAPTRHCGESVNLLPRGVASS